MYENYTNNLCIIKLISIQVTKVTIKSQTNSIELAACMGNKSVESHILLFNFKYYEMMIDVVVMWCYMIMCIALLID